MKSKPYLCSTALLRRSFSLFRTAASGLTWEIFSSSVPLMLDAWSVEGVSRPDSWGRRQGEQRFYGSAPLSCFCISWLLDTFLCAWLLFVNQHRDSKHVSDDSERVKGSWCQCLSGHMAQQVSQNWTDSCHLELEQADSITVGCSQTFRAVWLFTR